MFNTEAITDIKRQLHVSSSYFGCLQKYAHKVALLFTVTVSNFPYIKSTVVIGQTGSRTEICLNGRGVVMHLPERIKHEYVDLSGSEAGKNMNYTWKEREREGILI